MSRLTFFRMITILVIAKTHFSLLDIANAVRELTKVMDGASPAAFKELKRTISYVLNTKNLALQIQPTGELNDMWKIVDLSNSDFATDPVTRRRVSGYILYLCAVPIC